MSKLLRCFGYILAALFMAPTVAIVGWILTTIDFVNKAAAVWSEK